MTFNIYWILIGIILIISIYEFFLLKIDSFYLFVTLGVFLGGSLGYGGFGLVGLIIGALVGAWLVVMVIVLIPILFFGFLACNKECKKHIKN